MMMDDGWWMVDEWQPERRREDDEKTVPARAPYQRPRHYNNTHSTSLTHA
jgi:hypothetical protein